VAPTVLRSSAMRSGRPKKQADRVHGEMLRVRVTKEVDRLIRKAAASAARRKGDGDLSSWVREILTAAARDELAKNGGGSKATPN
jgi:uncharacterized protein (DUF1778 family)